MKMGAVLFCETTQKMEGGGEGTWVRLDGEKSRFFEQVHRIGIF